MVLDLKETPALKSVTINGQLSFIQNGSDVHLITSQIFVRAGSFKIGSVETPFNNEAKITIKGDRSVENLQMGGNVRAGNKVFAITGTAEFVGKPRSRWARLIEPVQKGSTILNVGTGLDWKEGDKIYIAPTTTQSLHSEYRTVTGYYASGRLFIDLPLDHYHFGAESSTEIEYNGLDIRGEVILLSRNIVINGEDASGHGA